MSIRAIHGDCREVLKTLPDESVHCVVTSPPYFGLRDYGTGQWEGGEADCSHIAPHRSMTPERSRATSSTFHGSMSTNNSALAGTPFRDECGKCGARRTDSQIGLEATPDAFVAELVAVFREVRRVLRSDGTLWLNLGDSYASSPASGGEQSGKLTGGEHKRTPLGTYKRPPGLKPKDLLGIPWMVAFALRADGWWLRQDIIWSKPNPMPESVRDRCTKAHEYLFLLSKSPRYFWDAEAIKEKADPSTQRSYSVNVTEAVGNTGGNKRTDFEKNRHTVELRNKRSVWEVATQSFTGAHFATFPPALIEPCIKAGCPRGGVVLDPFSGAGTTGLVADRLGRDAILIELNADYSGMSRRRIQDDAPLFAEVTA